MKEICKFFALGGGEEGVVGFRGRVNKGVNCREKEPRVIFIGK